MSVFWRISPFFVTPGHVVWSCYVIPIDYYNYNLLIPLTMDVKVGRTLGQIGVKSVDLLLNTARISYIGPKWLKI